MKQPGFVRGFFTALGLVVGLYAVQVFAKGQQVIIDRREAVALEEIAKQLIAIREEGVPIRMDPKQPITVKMAEGSEVRVKVADSVSLKNEFGNAFEVTVKDSVAVKNDFGSGALKVKSE